MSRTTNDLRAESVAFELLAEGYSVSLAVTGSSMSPFLRSHDVIVVAPLQGGAVVGDVVVYPRPGRGMVVHRVVAVDSKGLLLTRGDAVGEADGWISLDQVAGRVESASRRDAPVRCGVGAASRWIARLSRRGLLRYLSWPMRRWLHWVGPPPRGSATPGNNAVEG